MNSCLPISKRRTVAAAAQLRALLNAQLAAVARSQTLEFRGIVAVEAVIIPVATTVTQGEVFMFLGQENFAVRVKMNLHLFLLVVASVALEPGGIALCPNQFARRKPDRHGVGEFRIQRRHCSASRRLSPKFEEERGA